MHYDHVNEQGVILAQADRTKRTGRNHVRGIDSPSECSATTAQTVS
jgi:hypothetical protein